MITADFEVNDTNAALGPVLGFTRSESSRALLTAAAAGPGFDDLVLNDGGLDVALKIMRRGSRPVLLVYDVTGSVDPVADITALIRHGGRALPVIAVGNAIGTERFREFRAAGAFDYLDYTLGVAALADAVARARRQRTLRSGPAGAALNGRIIVFCGSRGGVGTTSSAISTAWTLAHKAETKTVLLDLDMSQGTIAFALDIDPGAGLREGLEQPARIDTIFLERCLVRESARFAVLSSEEPYGTDRTVDPAAAVILFDELKQAFDCIVVDLPRGSGPLNRAVLGAADEIVLVTSPTLVGLRDTIRLSEFISTTAKRAVVRLVLGPSEGGLPLGNSEFERAAGRKIDVTLPFDAECAAAAADSGKAFPAVAPDSALARAFLEVAVMLGYSEAAVAPRQRLRWPWERRRVQA